MIKVCKFGGTSMADGRTIARVKDILKKDPARRYVVVSAPGKRYSGEIKITDLLYDTYESVMRTDNCGAPFAKVKARFFHLADELKIDDFDIAGLLRETELSILLEKSRDFTASRGEYLSAKLTAAYFGIPFIDAKDIFRFRRDGTLDLKTTCALTSAALHYAESAVIAGFYGADEDGKIVTFSRGGSDISGAIVARAVSADLYENWTDVSGFLVCDPRIVENPAGIKRLTYRELGTLSCMGASVLHLESIFPVRDAGIPICIKNTFRPFDEGTLIVPERDCRRDNIITGIAGRNPCLPVTDFNALKDLLGEIRLPAHENTALIAVVGQGFKDSVGAAARVLKAVAQTGVSLRLIDYGSAEHVLYLGVNGEDYGRTIRAIYDEFYRQ